MLRRCLYNTAVAGTTWPVCLRQGNMQCRQQLEGSSEAAKARGGPLAPIAGLVSFGPWLTG